MTLTVEQRENRHKHLGSSDLPAVMGFSRFGNAYDIWLLKTQRVLPKERKEGYITAGNKFEPGVLDWFADDMGFGPIQKQDAEHDMERKVDGLPIVVHLDAEIVDNGEPVDAKTAGLYGPVLSPWGEAGTDEVPEYECIQAHCHMMATDREICHIPTFIAGGRGFGYFFVKRDNKIVELIKRQAIDFWENHVLKDVPPENIAPSLAMAKRIRSVEGETRQMDAEKVQQWLDAKDRATAAVKEKEFYHAGLLADLDGAEMGTCELGDITNFEQNRKGYTCEPTSFRVLRLKKRK